MMSNSIGKIILGISGLNLSLKLNLEEPILLFFSLSFQSIHLSGVALSILIFFVFYEVMCQNGIMSSYLKNHLGVKLIRLHITVMAVYFVLQKSNLFNFKQCQLNVSFTSLLSLDQCEGNASMPITFALQDIRALIRGVCDVKSV